VQQQKIKPRTENRFDINLKLKLGEKASSSAKELLRIKMSFRESTILLRDFTKKRAYFICLIQNQKAERMSQIY